MISRVSRATATKLNSHDPLWGREDARANE